jgi:hypothetical protein
VYRFVDVYFTRSGFADVVFDTQGGTRSPHIRCVRNR